MTLTGYLRDQGVQTPAYRKDSWEVDWATRNGKLVWARNPESKMPSARDWHWVDFHTLEDVGIRWKPKSEKSGRRVGTSGYVILTRKGMTDEEIALATEHGLFRGAKRSFVKEHQLVAVKKYGYVPQVVRHMNGVKTDNRPENLVGGTTQENTMDHNTARIMTMYWHERAAAAEAKLRELEAENGALQAQTTDHSEAAQVGRIHRQGHHGPALVGSPRQEPQLIAGTGATRHTA